MATVARKYLVENFRIDDTKLKTIGLGKSDEIGGTSQLQILVFAADAAPRDGNAKAPSR